MSNNSFIKQHHTLEIPLAACSALDEVAAVTLQNEIKVIVITDSKTKTSYGAASMFVGDHWDPVETPGLAHLTEHMLFLGTKRDPEEGGFDKFLSENAGMSNAYTEDCTTNYHFSVSNKSFKEALIRFCHFFVEPTLTPSGLEREVQAVHSEDEKNHTTDYWCFQEILKEKFCNKNHPHSRYGNGNAQTLWDGPKERGLNLHDFLLKFYNDHYLAENLVVVVYSSLPSAEVLDNMLIPILRDVRRNDFGKRIAQHSFHDPSGPVQAIDRLQLGTFTHIKSNEHMQRLDIIFPVPNTKSYADRFKTHYFISWLIGHECKGSIIDVLRKEVLATEMNTNEEKIDDENYLITASISLTTKGVRLVHKVIELFFDGVHFLLNSFKNDTERMKEIFGEMVAGDVLQFHVREIPSDTDEFVATIAQNCNIHSLETAWSSIELLKEINEDLIFENFDIVSKAENAMYFLWLPEPDQVIQHSEDFIKEHPDEKIEDHTLPHEEEVDDDEEEDDEDFDEEMEEEEEEDEEWLECEENDEEDEEGDCKKESHHHHHHHHHHHTHKLLPIDTFPAAKLRLNEKSVHHGALYSTPCMIEEKFLSLWSANKNNQDLSSKWKQDFLLPPLNPFISDITASCDCPSTSTSTNEDGADELPSITIKPSYHPAPTKIYESKWGSVLFQEFGDDNNDNGNSSSAPSKTGVPKGNVTFSIGSPHAYSTPKNRFFVNILSDVLEFALAELIYSAELGAYEVHCLNTWRGLYFEVSGPQQKLMIVIKSLIQAAFNEILNTSNEQKYRACADKILRRYHSANNIDAYLQAKEWYNLYIYKHRLHFQEILDAVNDTVPPFDEFKEFVRKTLYGQTLNYEMLVVTNTKTTASFVNSWIEFGKDFFENEIIGRTLQQQKSKKIVPCIYPDDFVRAEEINDSPTPAFLRSALPLPSSVASSSSNKKKSSSSSASPSPSPFFCSVISRQSSSTSTQDNNSSSVLTYHFGKSEPRILALSDVVSSLVESQYYDCLRTKETLGYIVQAYCISFEGHRFMRFIAQSADRSAVYCLSRTVAFIRAAAKQLFMIDEDESVADEVPQKRRQRTAQQQSGEEEEEKSQEQQEKLKKLNETIRNAAHSIANDRRNPAKNVTDLAERIWDLRNHPAGYQVDLDEAEFLDDPTKVNVDTVREFFKDYFLNPTIAQPVCALVHGHHDEDGTKQFSSTKKSSSSKKDAAATLVDVTLPKKSDIVKEKNDKTHSNKKDDDEDEEEEPEDEEAMRAASHPRIDVSDICSDFKLEEFSSGKERIMVALLTNDRQKYVEMATKASKSKDNN